MSQLNVIKFTNVDSVNSGYQNTSGWLKKTSTTQSPSNIELDRHLILRVKNVDNLNAVAGVIRFNEEKAGGPVFEGYDGIQWSSFVNTQSKDGKDGLNYKTIVQGENLVNTNDTNINYHSIFKNITTTITNDSSVDTDTDSGTDSQITATIHKTPTFKYDSNFTNKQFNLSNHNVIFEPNDLTSYKVYVNKNESWPPVDYSQHSKYSQLNNGVKLTSNSYIARNIKPNFKLYNKEYDTVYINQNGYLTFGVGESAFVQNLLQNHFSKYRISALFLNLKDDETSGSSSTYTTSDSDIFVGTGKYGEYVITFQNYIHNPGTVNYRVDFQIRLFLSDSPTDTNSLYSDDYYPQGTIQIAYNNNSNLINISPVVGISDSSGYDATNFTELYFSNLLTNTKRVATTETGIPFLRTFLHLQVNHDDSTSISNLNTKHTSTNTASNKQINSSGVSKFKLVLNDLDSDLITINDTTYGTSYQEDNYYIKTIDLGNITLQKLAVATRSDFDYEPTKNNSVVHYSDSTNYFVDKDGTSLIKNNTLETGTNWLSIPADKFIDLPAKGVYSTTNNKDYFNIYDNMASNDNHTNGIYNSTIYRIQARYQKQMDMSTTTPTLTNNLILKIIYTLNSDIDNNTGINLSNALAINFNRTTAGDNYGPYYYIKNDTDLFSITRIGSINASARFVARIYDYNMTAETNQISTSDEVTRSRTLARRIDGDPTYSNNSLTLELLDSSGSTLDTNKPTDTKQTGEVDYQNLKFFNQITKSDPSLTEQYYLKITGTHNLGYYGISLIESIDSSSETQVSGVYSNHKFSRINGVSATTLLPLTVTNSTITISQRIYSITKSDNLLFLISDSEDGEMRFYNYSFSGAIKSSFITSGVNGVPYNYNVNQEVLDMQFMGDKVLVARKNGTNINIDIFDFDISGALAPSTLTSTSSAPNINKVYMRVLTTPAIDDIPAINYGLIAYIEEGGLSYLNLYNFKEGDATLLTNTISGLTGAHVLDNIVNFLVFDKDNIFLIGNKGVTTPSGEIIKLSYDTTQTPPIFLQVVTTTVARTASGITVNKILYAEKYESGGDKYIVVFYQEGTDAATGYCMTIYTLDFATQYDQIFEYDGSRVTTLDNIIFNFKVKYSMILILWQDTSSFRYFQSYKIQLSDTSNPILKKKTSSAYSSTDFLMDVVLHNITLNSQPENIYVIIRKYLGAEDGNVFQLLIQIQKEDTNNVIIQFNSTTNYMKDLDFAYGGKSIFNSSSIVGERNFEITNEFNKLIKDPLPIIDTVNDEQLFFFGFDNTSKKLILEGFGKLGDVANTGATITASNEIVTIGASEANDGSYQLAIADISLVSNFATTEITYSTTTTELSQSKLTDNAATGPPTQINHIDLLDGGYHFFPNDAWMSNWWDTYGGGVEGRKNFVIKLETSLNTIIKTIDGTETFFTGVLHGPLSLEFNNSPMVSVTGDEDHFRFLMGVRGTFKFDIYSGNSYVQQNQFTITAVIGNYQMDHGENLKVIKFEDGFLIFYIDWDTDITDNDNQGHILKIEKFVVSTSGVWTRTTKVVVLGETSGPSNIRLDTRYTWDNNVDWPYIAIRHFMVDDGNTMFLKLFCPYLTAPEGLLLRNKWVGVRMSDLRIGSDWGSPAGTPAPGQVVTSGSPFHWYLLYKDDGILSYDDHTLADFVAGGNYGTKTYLNTMIHIKWITNKKYIYFLNRYSGTAYDGGSESGKMILIRCEQYGTDEPAAGWATIEPGSSYFNRDYLDLNFINIETTQVEGYSNSAPYPIDTDRHLYSQNVVYKNTTQNKIHIYFMLVKGYEFLKFGGTYFANYPINYTTLRRDTNDASLDLRLQDFTYNRIARLTINFDATASNETYEMSDSYAARRTPNIEDAGTAATNGPILEKETLINGKTECGNFSHFKMIVDSDSRYIIAGSNYTKSNIFGQTPTTWGTDVRCRIDREVLDFIVYKVKEDGDLILVCYGFNQRILSIHIENSNLVLFVPANTSGVFASNGKFTKVFKKPIVDINTQLDGTHPSDGATEIDLASFSPTIIEPENDTNNKLNYPQFFTNLNIGSNIVYNGGLHYNSDENMYQDNAPFENQVKNLKYNMIVGYSPSPDGSHIAYGDPKSFGISSFGLFTSIAATEEEEEEEESGSTTTTDTSIAGKLLHFNTQLGNSTDSSFVTGRYRNSTFNTNEDDTGVIFYSYNNPISITTDTANFYVRTNSIPNYEPIYAGNVIKGSWNNELSDNTNANYSIMPQNYGWLTPNTLTENGKYFKIPHTITNVSTKSILVGSTNISETFWYIGDSGWDAIMVNPGYYDSTATQNTDSAGYYITNSSLVTTNVNDKLFTPLGRIGVSVNGVVFYNFSNLERNKNAVEDLKPDIFGGMGDSLYAYHYHTWPVNLEGMLDLGHPDPSIQGSDYGRLPTLTDTSVGSGQSLNVEADLLVLTGSVTYPKYIYGMTYYFNQIDRSNYDSTTVNKFAIKFEPVFKGTIHRFKVRQFYSEYYLTPIDYSGTTTGSETRRLVISKIKQGDTIIFNHDATCTRLITITSREIDPGTGDAWPDYATLNTASQKTFTYEDLTTTSSVNVVSSSGNKYVFNGSSSYDINKLYLVQNGTYTINNIPSTHPIAILNNGKESNIAYSAVDTPIVIKVSGGTTTADTYGDYFTFTDTYGNPLRLANGTFKFMRGRTYRFIQATTWISGATTFHVHYNGTGSGSYLPGAGIDINISLGATVHPFYYYDAAGPIPDSPHLQLLVKTVTEPGENTAEYDFYYGSITLNVIGNFSAVSVYCYNHGFMGEQNLLVYNTSVDILKLNNHGFTTGDEIVYSITSGSTILTNLVNNTNYFAIRVDDHTLKIALTSENSHNGIAISVIPQTGTHTLDSIVSIKSNTLTQISTAGNDGALTYFNVPYNFDLGFLRYQPSGTITQFPDWGSYIITGSFYEYNVALAGTSTEKYYTLTPEGGTTIAGTTSPALTNIKFGDLVLFDQPEVDSTYDLKIKTGSATDSDTDPDNSGLFFQNTSLHFITFDAAYVETAGNGDIQIDSHGLSTNDPVTYRKGSSAIQVSGADLSESSIFYIIKVDADNIRLAISSGGTAMIFSDNGSGTHALSDIKYLYLSPKSDSSLAKTKLYYTTGADVTSVEVTGGSISLATYSRPTEYSFNNTLIRHGTPGNSYCPYTKFTIPNFSDIKVNRLALTLNSNKYEIYGNLTHNRYTLIQKNNIYVKLDVKQTYTVTAADVNIINNTINIEEHGYNTGNILTYNQGTTKIDGLVNNRNYYVINIDINTIKLATSEGLANVETNINFTTTGTGTQTFKIVDVPQRYKFYGKYNNTGYYETSSTEKITDLQLFNGTQYIFDVSDSSMSGITLRFSSSNTTFTEELSYSTANDKITTDITGIENNTLLYAFNSSDATNTNILGSTIITVKTAHSQFLTEFKLFRDTRYIIDVSLLATSQLPKFSTTLPSVSFEPANVNTTSNTITISSHSFSAGDNVTYIKGTTEIGGLTNNTEYFIINTTTNTIQLATTVSGSAISLTGIGTGSQTLRKIKVYNFPYYGADTFIHNTTTNLINFTVGDDINSLYIYNSEDTSIVSNLTMGSNYGGNIYSEKIYDLLNEIRVTDLSLDSTGDSGSGINSKEVISNIINVTITGSKFEFYATDQSIDNNHKFDFYVESTTNNITTLKLYNNTKYIIKYFDTMKHTDNILKFTSNETPANYAANNITFDDTYDDSIANQISFVVKGLSSKTQTIYVYNGKSGEEAVDMTGNVTTTIQAQNPKPINIYTDVNSSTLRFFRNPTTKDYFNGFLDYENAENYITKKLTRTGAPGHSPLLGYAFDGHPIYGPLGYDKDDSSYTSSATTFAAQASFKVKLMKSSYTGGNDNDGNPTYIQSSGDLDICNGVFLKTPEFPKGIYHYVCTIELKIDGSQKLSTDSNYGYLNEPNTIVKATYPYVIGAYKGLPEKSNFNTTSTTTTLSAASSQITTYKMNFKSIKAENNKFNGSNFQSLDIYSDDNYINMCSRTQPYIWNFTNEQNEDSFFGKANKDYGSTISSLRSLTTDTKFKAYGNVSKWICKENISAGLAVRLVNNTRNITVDGVVTSITTLEVELYDSRTSPNERNIGAAFLGIALNDTTTGNSCFVCTKGITTVKIGKSLGTGVKCGSYGILVFSTVKGYIIGLDETDIISSDVAIAGYFLEDLSSVAFDQLVLFQVQGNYEFN